MKHHEKNRDFTAKSICCTVNSDFQLKIFFDYLIPGSMWSPMKCETFSHASWVYGFWGISWTKIDWLRPHWTIKLININDMAQQKIFFIIKRRTRFAIVRIVTQISGALSTTGNQSIGRGGKHSLKNIKMNLHNPP